MKVKVLSLSVWCWKTHRKMRSTSRISSYHHLWGFYLWLIWTCWHMFFRWICGLICKYQVWFKRIEWSWSEKRSEYSTDWKGNHFYWGWLGIVWCTLRNSWSFFQSVFYTFLPWLLLLTSFLCRSLRGCSKLFSLLVFTQLKSFFRKASLWSHSVLSAKQWALF